MHAPGTFRFDSGVSVPRRFRMLFVRYQIPPRPEPNLPCPSSSTVEDQERGCDHRCGTGGRPHSVAIRIGRREPLAQTPSTTKRPPIPERLPFRVRTSQPPRQSGDTGRFQTGPHSERIPGTLDAPCHSKPHTPPKGPWHPRTALLIRTYVLICSHSRGAPRRCQPTRGIRDKPDETGTTVTRKENRKRRSSVRSDRKWRSGTGCLQIVNPSETSISA